MKIFYFVVTLICLSLAGIAGYSFSVLTKKATVIKNLQSQFNLVSSETKSQKNIIKEINKINSELAAELKKSKIKVNSLTSLTVKYKKQIAKIKSSKVKQITPTTQEVTFSKTLDFGILSGSFEAEKIINPKGFQFVFEKSPEEISIVDTEAGLKAYSKSNQNIEVKSIKTSKGFFDDVAFVAGVELSQSIKPSVLAGIEYKKIILYGRVGADPAIGIMKRWSFK